MEGKKSSRGAKPRALARLRGARLAEAGAGTAAAGFVTLGGSGRLGCKTVATPVESRSISSETPVGCRCPSHTPAARAAERGNWWNRSRYNLQKTSRLGKRGLVGLFKRASRWAGKGRGWRFVVKPTHINAVNEALSAIALEIAAAPVSPILLLAMSRTVTEALTFRASAIAPAPASPI